jgi:acetate kinase
MALWQRLLMMGKMHTKDITKTSKNLYFPIEDKKQASHLLVINSGSSSLKASLFFVDIEKGEKNPLQRALDTHLQFNSDKSSSFLISSFKGTTTYSCKDVSDINSALELTLNYIFSSNALGFSSSSLYAIGHRVVHGGEKHTSSARITPNFIQELEEISYLAPLHNVACIQGIKSTLKRFSQKISEVAVFDTTFHSQLPDFAAKYAIPKELSSKYHIKRYGFHGISHESMWRAYASLKKKSVKPSKVITLHLGSGCSMSAIKDGLSIDTSMGFTPLEGLMMSTRSGDVDPSLTEFLCHHENKTVEEVMHLLNFQSGLRGVSGISSDMKILLEEKEKNASASLAILMFTYRALKYLGAYIAVLGGVNAIIFSGGIGENSSAVREIILDGMSWFGVKLEKENNLKAIDLLPGEIQKISEKDSTVEIYVFGADENMFIAQETVRILQTK